MRYLSRQCRGKVLTDPAKKGMCGEKASEAMLCIGVPKNMQREPFMMAKGLRDLRDQSVSYALRVDYIRQQAKAQRPDLGSAKAKEEAKAQGVAGDLPKNMLKGRATGGSDLESPQPSGLGDNNAKAGSARKYHP